MTGNTSALRGRANFAGFAPTKAAQRILAEAMARDLGPKGVHVAYIVIDAVIDLAWTARALSRCARRLLHQARGHRRRGLACPSAGPQRLVVQRRNPPVRREVVSAMADLRIFSYLPNPRIWKATIAARLNGVDLEVRGAKPSELTSWLWDFDARPLSAEEKGAYASAARARPRRLQGRQPDQDRCVPVGTSLRDGAGGLQSRRHDRHIRVQQHHANGGEAGRGPLANSTAAIPTRRPASTASSMPASSSGVTRNPISSPFGATTCRPTSTPAQPRLSPSIWPASSRRCIPTGAIWLATPSPSPTSASWPSFASSPTSAPGGVAAQARLGAGSGRRLARGVSPGLGALGSACLIIRPLRRMSVLIWRSWRHLPHDPKSRARRCPHRRGWSRHQLELCEAVREGGHARRSRGQTAGQAGPAGPREEPMACAGIACDAADPAAIELLFRNVVKDLGTPTLVVHNIDGRVPGIFRKGITEAEPGMALDTLRNAAFSAFLVGQQAARLMRENEPNANGAKGTIIFTNASAALKGFPSSGAFAMACHAKSGLAQSMARELMPQGIHVANVPIDAAIGWTQEDGTPRAPAGRNDRRRQHGRPRPHRRDLSAAASPAPVDLGVRSGASTDWRRSGRRPPR